MTRAKEATGGDREGIHASNPTEWIWQLRNCVTSLESLESKLVLTDSEREGIKASVSKGFPMSITPYYLSLCDPYDSNCPIRKQCVPRREESLQVPGDMRDPLNEEAQQKAPHLVQRYPDRVLLLATDNCAVYCRFCTRSRLVGRGKGVNPIDSLQAAFSYIARNPQIREVIISGGDPMLMLTEQLAAILDRLAAIQSVSNVRIASRVLTTLPQRVTVDLCQAIRLHESSWVMSHFNHPKELTEQSGQAATMLIDHGIPIMNQTVLLRGINDSVEVIEALFRGLTRFRIRPYYLLQADPVQGTSHFRTPIKTGIDVMARLQGNLSGIALPKLMIDTPGGKGKVPVGSSYIERHQARMTPGTTTLRTFRGERVDYIDPPSASKTEGTPIDPGWSSVPPSALRPGDTVAVVAPAGPFNIEAFEGGVARLETRYRVLYDRQITARHGYLAGDDQRRIRELLAALESREVQAIVSARGGYGTTRLLDAIEPSFVAANPKPLIGFSDITGLHAVWARARVRSIHGSNLVGLADLDQHLFNRWISIVEGATPEPMTGLNRISGGVAVGPLIGGNLSVINALVGTPFAPPLSGSVLFLEDIREPPYRIDRMLTCLRQAGWLEQLVAIALGAFETVDSESSGIAVEATLADRLGDLEIPVVSGIPAGHIPNNAELALGATVSVNADKGIVEFLEPATKSKL